MDLRGLDFEVCLVPQDMNTHNPGNWINMQDHDEAILLIICGAMAATCDITVNIGTDTSGTHDSTFAFDEYYKKADVSAYATEDATPSGIWTRTTGAAGTIATGATANQIFAIPFKAADLGVYSYGLPYKYVQVHISDPGNTDLISALMVFPKQGSRFNLQIPKTVVDYP